MIFNHNAFLVKIPHPTIIPFFLLIGWWSLFPSRLIPNFQLFDVTVNAGEFLLCIAAIPYILLLLADRYLLYFWSNYTTIGIFISLAIYSGISLYFSDVAGTDRTAAYITIIYYIASFVFAYSFVIFSRMQRHYILWLTLLLTAVSALYLAQSLFSLGFRAISYTDFGIDRVKGPLFGSATGHLILLPALGFMLDELVNRRRRSIINLICLVIIFSTLLGLGSRAGLICLALFIIGSIIITGNLKNKLILVVTTLIIATTSYGLIFSKADSSRLASLEDKSREVNLITSVEFFTSGDTMQKLFGHGYSSVWNWYILDKSGDNLYATGEIIQNSKYGLLLYHPHSTFLLFVIELGVIGTLFILILIMLLIRRLLKNVSAGHNIFLGVSIMSTIIANIFDFFIFKNFVLTAIWFVYIVYYLASSDINSKR